jgi:carbon-monoxide dehydrogenase medium subunit
MWQDYVCPDTVDGALTLLAAYAGQARVIAGGTDLVLQLKRGERRAACLVDVSRIDALQTISESAGTFTLGAAVTHAQIASSQLIRDHVPVLSQAAAEVGSPEIRNAGTVGGNVVNAQPAADTALALLALDAEAEIVSADGSRWVALPSLYEGAGLSAVDSTQEIVRSFRFRPQTEPAAPAGRVGSAYRRLGKCKSIALPILCAAAVVQMEGDRFASSAISLGPVAPYPFRARRAEAWLVDRPATADTIARAATLAQEEANPRESLLRCGKAYREAMVSVLVRSTLGQAVGAAAQSAGNSL